MTFNNAIILAAGRGERMRPVTDYIPKALYKPPECKLTLLDLAIQSLPYVSNLNITYGYLGHMIISEYCCNNYTFIGTNGKGNASVFSTIARYINEPTIIIPCDISFAIDWGALYNEFVAKKCSAMIVPVSSELGVGDFIEFDNGLIDNMKKFTKTPYIASGIQIVIPSEIPKYDNFYDVWNELVYNKMLAVSNITPRYWKAIDTIQET